MPPFEMVPMDPLNRHSAASWMESGYNSCYYSGLLGRGWSIAHSALERPFDASMHFPVVLELGAGQGQHLAYVEHDWTTYHMTDIAPGLLPRTSRLGLDTRRIDAADLASFATNSIDRLIATCLIAHMHDPFAALVEWRRVVRPGGWLSLYVAIEPSLANRTLRKAYIWPRSKRFGAEDPKFLMWSQHMIHYPALRSFLGRVFANDYVSRLRFPTRLSPWNLAFFEVWQIRLAEDS